MGEEGGTQQPLHQRLSGFRAAAALTVVFAAAFFMTYGNATTLAPNWVNTTGGSVSEIGSLDGGGNPIQVNDDLSLSANEIVQSPSVTEDVTFYVYKDGSTIYAKNQTGQIEKSGSDAETVIQYALDNTNHGIVRGDRSNQLQVDNVTIGSNTAFENFRLQDTSPTNSLVLLKDGASNVIIRDNRLDGAGTPDRNYGGTGVIDTTYGAWGENIVVMNNYIHDAKGKGIFLKHERNAIVKENTIDNAVLGISVRTEDIRVIDNKVMNTMDAFIDAGAGAEGVSNVIIANNIGRNMTSHGLGIDIYGNISESKVVNNIVYVNRAGADTISDGIAVHSHTISGTDYHPDDVDVLGNTVYRADRNGIQVSSPNDDFVVGTARLRLN